MTAKKTALYATISALCFLISQTEPSKASNEGNTPTDGTGCSDGSIGIASGTKFFPNERSEMYRLHGPEYVKKICLPYIKALGYKIEN